MKKLHSSNKSYMTVKLSTSHKKKYIERHTMPYASEKKLVFLK